MKKYTRFVSFMAAAFLVCTFVSCTPARRPVNNLKDGTYEAEGDRWQYGYENATIIVKDSAIKSITLRRLDTQGKEVNYDEWVGQERDGKIYPNLKQYRIDMANRMLEKQDYNVDTIAGATISTENWKLAVRRTLEKAGLNTAQPAQ